MFDHISLEVAASPASPSSPELAAGTTTPCSIPDGNDVEAVCRRPG